MSEVLKNISVIVPFTASDLLWKDLLQDLKMLPKESEILLVGPEMPDLQILKKATETVLPPVRYVKSERGRAVQLNTGAKNAGRDFFWFLHADTKVPRVSIFLLEQALREQPESLHFFNLQFLADGPATVKINSWAANLRSRLLHMPFGDQGFCVSRSVFYKVGGFDQCAKYGEDHVFVWEARRKRVPLNNIAGSVFTSARRYKTEGWGKLTRRRVFLTYKQALKETLKLLKQRAVENFNS